MRAGILQNETKESSDNWVQACLALGIEYSVIDITSPSWLNDLSKADCDFCLLRPPSAIERFKILYDERMYIITDVLKLPVYPTYKECIIYENKKMLSYFLEANKVPHPKTHIFYLFDEAISFVQTANLPIVAKTSVGAGGTGVKVLKNKKEALRYCKEAFLRGGVKKPFGPNKATGTPKIWIHKAVKNPQLLLSKIKFYKERTKSKQYGYVIFQKFIPHSFEWRVVKIGGSFFAYKKYKVGDKASGAKNLGFDNPPLKMLDFVRTTSLKLSIQSAAFDLFEYNNTYLVNEIQTIFGHKMDHLLEVDGHPGRYIYSENRWVFEKGFYNENKSYNLRLSVYLKAYKNDLIVHP